MSIRYALTIVGLAAGIGGLILPALAQTQDNKENMPDQHMGRMESGHMGHGMMSGRGMMGGKMSGGCAEMMRSMNGGDGQPNSQWQTHRHGDATPN